MFAIFNLVSDLLTMMLMGPDVYSRGVSPRVLNTSFLITPTSDPTKINSNINIAIKVIKYFHKYYLYELYIKFVSGKRRITIDL